MPFTFGHDSFNTGDSTGIQCIIVKGDLPIKINWVLDFSPVVSGEDGIVVMKMSTKNSILNIASVDEAHRGVFKCVAENMAGKAEYSSELHVNGASRLIKFFLFVFSFLCFLSLAIKNKIISSAANHAISIWR